jgi:hypothetical protein
MLDVGLPQQVDHYPGAGSALSVIRSIRPLSRTCTPDCCPTYLTGSRRYGITRVKAPASPSHPCRTLASWQPGLETAIRDPEAGCRLDREVACRQDRGAVRPRDRTVAFRPVPRVGCRPDPGEGCRLVQVADCQPVPGVGCRPDPEVGSPPDPEEVFRPARAAACTPVRAKTPTAATSLPGLSSSRSSSGVGCMTSLDGSEPPGVCSATRH